MIRNLAYQIARVLRRIASIIEKLTGTQIVAVRRVMSGYDMVSQPDEIYYLDQYWQWLLPELERRFPDRQAHAVDIGCGQGRLALPLAEWLSSGSVVGVDVTDAAIKQAQTYSLQRGLANVEFHQADALDYVRSVPTESIDLALMVEVSFFMPSYRDVIAEVARALKKNGMFFVSFRSQYFDLLHSVRSHDWSSARLVRDQREGNWGGGITWFSWHTVEDVAQLLGEAGFSVEQFRGIGIASGVEGDPLSVIAQPSKLPPSEQAELMELETSLAQHYADCGRYILAVAVKNG